MPAHLQPIQERMDRYSIPEPNTGCLLWLAQIDRDGYGRVWLDGKKRGAHVVAYELLNGPVPEGLEIDHICRMRCCVNPEHMEPVTSKVNTSRGVAAIVNSGQKKFVCEQCGGSLEIVSRRAPRNGRKAHLERGCRNCRLLNHRRWRGSVSRAEYLANIREK